MTIKSKLPRIMNEHGYSVRRLERESGVSHATIMKARAHGNDGIASVTPKVLEKIAKTLGIKVCDILDEE